jgi:hypothetical protein
MGRCCSTDIFFCLYGMGRNNYFGQLQ